jgi:hypothetical protein
MEGSTWLLIIGIFLLVIGGGLMIYGIHKHEDENEKTTTHKAFLYGGIALLLIGLILIIVYFVNKGRKPKESLSIDTKDVPEIEMAPMNQGYNNQMNQGYGNPMNQGYGNQGYGNPMNQGINSFGNPNPYGGPMTPIYQSPPDMGQGYGYGVQGYGNPMNQGYNQFSM